MKPVPQSQRRARAGATREFERQGALTGARDAPAQLRLVGREDMNAFAAPRNGDVPLLIIRGGAHRRIGEQDVINRLALRSVGCDRVAADELAEVRFQHPAIAQLNATVGAG